MDRGFSTCLSSSSDVVRKTKVVVWVELGLDPASSVEQFRGGTLASRKIPQRAC